MSFFFTGKVERDTTRITGGLMLMQHEIKKLIKDLVSLEAAHIELGGSSISLKTFADGNRLFLSTPVYFGGNYIPKSVRGCVKKKAPFGLSYLQTSLQIDEENFRIYLNCVDGLDGMSEKKFILILEDFCGLAEKWREYLDEHDKNDLIYVPSRPGK